MFGIKTFIKNQIIAKIPVLEKARRILNKTLVSTGKTSRRIRVFFNNVSASLQEFEQKRRIDNLIVSFTSFPARIAFVEYTLFSLINQTIRPEKIILWLSEEEFPLEKRGCLDNLLKYRPFGFEIQFVKENYRSYKKLVYSLEKYPDSIIVTADDDLFYKPAWLDALYATHLAHPGEIIAHRIHSISFTGGSQIDHYLNWRGEKTDASFLNFPTGCGGILYPPHALYRDILNRDIFLKLCPHADDIWFFVMALLQGTKIRWTADSHDLIFFDYIFSGEFRKIPSLQDINNGQSQNDVQLRAALNYYNIYDSFHALYGNSAKEGHNE